MYNDYIIFEAEKKHGAADPKRSAEGGNMKEHESKELANTPNNEKLTDEQIIIINEICDLLKDEELQKALKAQLKKDRELLPYIRKELKKAKKDMEYNNISVFEVLEAQSELDDAEANHPKSKAFLILEKALRTQALHQNTPLQPDYKIKNVGMSNNTLVNYLRDNESIGTGAFNLSVLPKQSINTYAIVQFQDLENEPQIRGIYSKIKNITEIEHTVLDRIYSIKKHCDYIGKPCLIDGYIIASCMPGAAGKTTQQEAAFYNSIIEKFRHMFLYIDATDELRARGVDIPEGDTVIFDDYCISTKSAKYRNRRGDIKPCYLLRDIPLIHSYAEQTNQIINVPADLFNIKETMIDKKDNLILLDSDIKLTRTRQNIVTYLLRRIFTMKDDYNKAKELYRKHEEKRTKQEKQKKPVDDYKTIKDYCKQRHVILFATLYEKVNIKDPSRTEAARIRSFCKEALNYWKAKGIIKDYEIITGKDSNIKINLES